MPLTGNRVDPRVGANSSATNLRWPPEVFLIGAQKAGTTSLAAWMAAHRDIAVSTPKETDFFTGRWAQGWEWYANCFKNARGTVLVDASTSYSMAPLPGTLPPRALEASLLKDVPKRIFAARPDARFIYVLRDPIDRAYSAYWHGRRGGYESRPLREAATASSLYIRGSSYSYQIRHYLEFFPIERFLFLDFRQLRTDPEAVLRQCWDFIGVEPIEPSAADARNEGFQFNRAGQLITSLIGGNRPDSFLNRQVTRRLPRPVRGVLRRILTTSIPPITDEERAFLNRHVADEYAKTLVLSGIDFQSALPWTGRW